MWTLSDWFSDEMILSKKLIRIILNNSISRTLLNVNIARSTAVMVEKHGKVVKNKFSSESSLT